MSGPREYVRKMKLALARKQVSQEDFALLSGGEIGEAFRDIEARMSAASKSVSRFAGLFEDLSVAERALVRRLDGQVGYRMPSRGELVVGPIGFAGEFKYRPVLTGSFVKWKRVGSFGPWVQEFGGVS